MSMPTKNKTVRFTNEDEVKGKYEGAQARERLNVVISFEPVPGVEFFAGSEAIQRNEEGYITEVDEDYKSIFALYGTTIEEFMKWGNDAVLESKSHMDDECYFNKYAFRDGLHSNAAKENPFMHSLYQEIENASYRPTELVFLASMSLDDALSLKEAKSITFGKGVVSGLFEDYNGAGSVLEITLDKEITLPLKELSSQFRVAIDGEGRGYGVDSVYGLTSQCWTEDYKIEPKGTPIKSLLEAEGEDTAPSAKNNL